MTYPLSDNVRLTIQRHFKRKSLVWNEAFFLDVLATSAARRDVYWAVIALRDCGTLGAIPSLKEKLYFPMRDVQSCSILTIAHIAGAAESTFYGEVLLDSKYREKDYALWAVRDAADERAVPFVVAYLKKNWAKLKRDVNPGGKLADALQYLEKHRLTHSEIRTFFTDVEGSWEKLSEIERTRILKQVVYFSERFQ